jgi:Asp-tRNA(Asn)/Glu-tRNA(Gln) amidotransferase A subunit family amidase
MFTISRRASEPALVLVAILLALCTIGFAAQQPTSGRTFDLLTASISDVQAAVDAGRLTYERLVQMYLRRIEAFDKQGPKLNAVIVVNPKALDVARELDRERATRGRRSPLHGIPIAIKDTIDVSDVPSAGGNLALGGTFPAHDATIIHKLRAAGAIILLKANLDEFNLGSQGLSSLGGQVLNPYDLKRNPGGSSAGTGVSVNVGFATVGVGTETGASIRSPASNNSLVGIAPSQGLVSRAGLIVISYTQDRAGPHAKSVADAATLLTYLRGFDPEDLFTWESLGKVDPRPYTEALDPAGLRGTRIGVFRDLFRRGEQFASINALLEKEIEFIGRQGAVLVDGLSTGMDLVKFFPLARASTSEFRVGFDAYLRRRGPNSPVKTLAELVATGKYLKNLDGQFKEGLKSESPEFDKEYLARLQNRLTIRKLITDLMDKYQVEALVHPFKSVSAPPIGTGDRGIRDNPISAITGLPAIVVPAGLNEEGLPISLELLGRPFSEPTLIRIAHAYEQASLKRVAPKSAPHLDGEVFTY